MKLKYYLRGLGAGLIITTLILTISNVIRNAGNNNSNPVQNERETVGSVIAYTTAADENNTDSDNGGTKNSEESASGSQNQTSEASSESQKNSTVSVRDDGVVVVVFRDVYYGTQAADILYEAGVISNRDAFVSYLSDSGYALRIRDGEYELTVGDSFENIARIITKS